MGSGLYACIHTCSHVCGSMCAYMWESIVMLEIFDHSSTLFFRTEFLSQTQNLQFCLLSLISLFRDPISLLSQAGITGGPPCSHSSYMDPGVLSSDLLACEASLFFLPLNHLPSFLVLFFKKKCA